MPYLMRLSRYSLLAQFILTQTASAQLPRPRRLAGAPHLSLGALSSLARLAILWPQMRVLLALIPVLVDRSSVSRSSLSPASLLLFLNSLSLPVGPVVIGSTVGKNWGFGAAPRRSQNASLSRHLELCAWGRRAAMNSPERAFLPHARTGICERFSIFPVEKSVDLPRNSADFGAKMAENRKNSLGK